MIKIGALMFSLLFGAERMGVGIDGIVKAYQTWYPTTTLEMAYEPVRFVQVYGSVKTDFVPEPGSVYSVPFHNRYDIGAKLQFGIVEFGLDHMCGHPSQAWNLPGGLQYDESRELIWVKVSAEAGR